MCGAPFDLIGDMLRGRRGSWWYVSATDKLQEAMKRLTPIVIDEAIGRPMPQVSVIFMPLHKGLEVLCPASSLRPSTGPPQKGYVRLIEAVCADAFCWGDYMPVWKWSRICPEARWYVFEAMDMAKAKESSEILRASPAICPPPCSAPARPRKSKKAAIASSRPVRKGAAISWPQEQVWIRERGQFAGHDGAAKEYGVYK